LKTENHFWACSAGIQQDVLTAPEAATQTSAINSHLLAADLARQRGCSSQARELKEDELNVLVSVKLDKLARVNSVAQIPPKHCGNTALVLKNLQRSSSTSCNSVFFNLEINPIDPLLKSYTGM